MSDYYTDDYYETRPRSPPRHQRYQSSQVSGNNQGPTYLYTKPVNTTTYVTSQPESSKVVY